MEKIKEVADMIMASRTILAATGAGISTSCGIPDFRSEGGIYETAGEKYSLPYPEALFDINYFPRNPDPFFAFTRSVLNQEIKPSYTHKFLADLENQGKLIKIFTQNIDHLHRKAGSENILECHGTFETAHCFSCKRSYCIDDYLPTVNQNEIPQCECGGIIKPDVVFFGEQLPSDFYAFMENSPEFDLVLLLGTSLTVQPFAQVALQQAISTRSVIVNRDATPYDHEIDIVVNTELDSFFKQLSLLISA